MSSPQTLRVAAVTYFVLALILIGIAAGEHRWEMGHLSFPLVFFVIAFRHWHLAGKAQEPLPFSLNLSDKAQVPKSFSLLHLND